MIGDINVKYYDDNLPTEFQKIYKRIEHEDNYDNKIRINSIVFNKSLSNDIVVTIELDELVLSLYHKNAWAQMHLYQGFICRYRSEGNFFEIGGGEVEYISAKSIKSLLNKLSILWKKEV